MLCPDCNTYAAEDDIVCPRCGKLLDEAELQVKRIMTAPDGSPVEVDFHEEMRNFNNLQMFENFQGLKWLVWILKSLYKL